ncbi:hypothetical protein, partial [Arcobacter sp.]|uniref:hypothetical protein n=1 Tax=Arcobacter sp. TaxID=1872629 RepID=UPI003D0C2F56
FGETDYLATYFPLITIAFGVFLLILIVVLIFLKNKKKRRKCNKLVYIRLISSINKLVFFL